jgi:hypothetical protein
VSGAAAQARGVRGAEMGYLALFGLRSFRNGSADSFWSTKPVLLIFF